MRSRKFNVGFMLQWGEKKKVIKPLNLFTGIIKLRKAISVSIKRVWLDNCEWDGEITGKVIHTYIQVLRDKTIVETGKER